MLGDAAEVPGDGGCCPGVAAALMLLKMNAAASRSEPQHDHTLTQYG
jgi:hypothetical protein